MSQLICAGTVVSLVAVFVACKPLVRQAVSDISAVSDAHLTLGVVPIERSDGMHAYLMLICKKARVYSSGMLADDNRCRVALLDHNGAEVAFLPNEFKRDFATKYKGYAKAVVVSLAIVPVALAAGYAGAWRHARKIKAPKRDFLLQLEWLNKYGENGWRYYQSAWNFELVQHIKAARTAKNSALAESALAGIRSSAESLSDAAELKAIEDIKKILDGYEDWPHNKKRALYDEIKKEVDDYKEPPSFPREDFLELNIEYLSKQSRLNFDNMETYGHSFVGNTLQFKQWKINEKYLDYFEKTYLSKEERIERYGYSFKHYRHGFLYHLDERWARIVSNVSDKGENKIKQADKLRKEFASLDFFGAAGLGLATMLAIDKSIWGYEERQVSKYWNQVFVENEDLKNTRAVKDIVPILQALADEFDFVVNARALQLTD